MAEATLKYDGLSVEAATRGGTLEPYSAPPNLALAVLGTGLFAFLQGRIAATCRNVYPVNPGIVDEGLAENILRDSCDPGAVGVIAAGGKLPFSRSANEMLGKFGVREGERERERERPRYPPEMCLLRVYSRLCCTIATSIERSFPEGLSTYCRGSSKYCIQE